MFRLWFSFKNNRRTNVLLVGIFENLLKKAISCQKRHFGRFWRLLTFFSAFSKILTKTTFVRLLFLKLKQKKNMKTIFLRFLFPNLKMLFLWVNQKKKKFVCVFSKKPTKRTFVRLLFWKLNQSPNMKNSFFSFQKPKTCFGGPK